MFLLEICCPGSVHSENFKCFGYSMYEFCRKLVVEGLYTLKNFKCFGYLMPIKKKYISLPCYNTSIINLLSKKKKKYFYDLSINLCIIKMT